MNSYMISSLVDLGRSFGLSDKRIKKRIMEIWKAEEDYFIKSKQASTILNLFKQKGTIKL